MPKLQVYNGKEWVEIAKDGKDAVVDYDYILSQIPKPKDGIDGKDGFVDEATIAYLEDLIRSVETKAEKKSKYSDGIGLVVRQLRAGDNITIDDTNQEYPIINATGGPGGDPAWGDITGTLADQTDLQTALNGKQATLVSGTNIKTVNGTSLVGSGDVSISSAVAWGSVTGTLSSQTDLQSALDGKANALGVDDNYVTDAEKTKLANLSGTNTGDQDLSGYALTSHNHTGVYEPADSTILKDADIGVNVQAYSAVLANTTASFTTADETKLDGIASGAEVNQNAFTTIAVSGQSDVVADQESDTLTLAAGTNITITTNAGTDTVTINATGGGGGITLGAAVATSIGYNMV